MHEFSTELKDKQPTRYSVFVDNGQVAAILEHGENKSLMLLREETENETFENMFKKAARFLAKHNTEKFGEMKEGIVPDHRFWKIAESVLYEILREYQSLI